jgi:hypothetical protein
VRGNGIGQLAGIVDLIDRDQHLRRDLLVQLDVLLELADHGARQGIHLAVVAGLLLKHLGIGLKEIRVVGELGDAGALAAFDQHLDRAVGQLEQLQDGTDRAYRIDVGRRRLVLRRVLLGHQKNLLVVLHDVFQRPHRLIAADEEWHDHVREDHDVAKRKNREQIAARNIKHQTISPI